MKDSLAQKKISHHLVPEERLKRVNLFYICLYTDCFI